MFETNSKKYTFAFNCINLTLYKKISLKRYRKKTKRCFKSTY